MDQRYCNPSSTYFSQIPSGALCEFRFQDGRRAKHTDDVNCENGDISVAKVKEYCQDKASCKVKAANFVRNS